MSNNTVPTTFLAPSNAHEAFEIANNLAQSNLIPTSLKGKPADIVVSMAYGAELGLQPLQSLQNISVINGRPALWGDAMRALVLNSSDLMELKEWAESGTFFCTIARKTKTGAVISITKSFGDEDAKKAKLFGKQGPWTQYPSRMKQMRAFGFAARDAYADRLRGFITREEAQDIPSGSHSQEPERDITPAQPVDALDSLLEKASEPEPINNDLITSDLVAEFNNCGDFEDLAVTIGKVKEVSVQLSEENKNTLTKARNEAKARIQSAPQQEVEF